MNEVELTLDYKTLSMVVIVTLNEDGLYEDWRIQDDVIHDLVRNYHVRTSTQAKIQEFILSKIFDYFEKCDC